MGMDRTGTLTESQRAYLRLVLEHRSSKEIARRFGISAHTVDKRIKEAMRILDVGSRVEAARMVAAADMSESPGFSLGPQTPDLDFPPLPVSVGSGDGGGDGGRAISTGVMVGEEQVAFRTHSLRRRIPLPFPTADRPTNTLSLVQRLAWTIGLIIGLALATGFLLSGLSAVGTLIVAMRH
jgi:DNA-binding CsgD family transcriptional regulator